MTCAEAKDLPILAICDRLDAKRAYVKPGKMYALYHAPYRQDVHPSLRLDLKANRWYDLATRERGDVIDLVALTLKCDVAQALRFLDNGAEIRKTNRNPMPVKKKNNEISKDFFIKPLRHPALLAYVFSRGISEDIAKRFLCEIHTTTHAGKHCFALAFPSMSGGYELRNATFKGCVGPKDISVIGSGPVILFFEGQFDFMTHVHLYGYMPKATYVILNSTSLVERALDCLSHLTNPVRVEIWLDNDLAGRAAGEVIKSRWDNVYDASVIYAQYNDLNEYLCKDNQIK